MEIDEVEKLTEKYKLLFKLLGAAALGRDSVTDEKFDSEIIDIARKNGVLGLIISELKKCYDTGILEASQEQLDSVIFDLSSRITGYSKKQYAVNEVVKKLENIGISCVMLKGDTLGVMYRNPDFRMSNDTDILIDKKDERKCFKFFKSENSYIKKRTASNNQSVVVHPKGGVFEIHISMDTKQISEVWYDNIDFVQEPYREVTVAGMYTYKTLGYTDNAINLMLHFIKHFVGGIAHVRMMTDTVLYFEAYHDKIDFTRFWKTMKHLKYEHIAESLMYIGNCYFGFENINFKKEYKEFADKIISDIADCCEYGYSALEKKGGIYNLYSQKRYSTFMKDDYKRYQKKILVLDAFDLIFKNKYEMVKLYPVLEKHMYLLPFMYCHRAVNCILNTIFPKRKKALIDETFDKLMDKRMKLIDELDMI